MFDVREVPQIPSIQFWRGSGGATSERGSDSAEPHLRGIFDTYGHLMVLMTYNTDIADAWEREGEDPQFFYRFSPAGYALGINVLLHADDTDAVRSCRPPPAPTVVEGAGLHGYNFFLVHRGIDWCTRRRRSSFCSRS